MNVCFYCEHLLTCEQRTEWDHFPVPKCAGGTGMVPSCHHCHREKTHMAVSRLVKRLFDSVRARELLKGWMFPESAAGNAWWQILALGSSVLRYLREDGLAAAEADLRGESYFADGIGDKELLLRLNRHWHELTRDMRLAAGAALENMYAEMSFERENAKELEWLTE